MELKKVIIALCITCISLSACNENPPSIIEDDVVLHKDDVIVSNVDLFNVTEGADTNWKVENYYSTAEIDTLLVDFVSYIYKKPSVATWATKFNPEFRKYYINHTDRFEIIYYTIINDIHYYYLLRPARNEEGFQQRGVGGLFMRNASNTIVEFEEVFNTVIMSPDSLIKVGYHLFDELTKTNTIDNFVNERSIVEWPDGSLFYSKEKKEWRYVE
jgi:hypothetical protein